MKGDIIHERGYNKSTKFRRPFVLIYCEYFSSKIDAQRREKYFKTSAGKKGLKLIIRDTLNRLGRS